jgi:methylmalonyl-CoA mutase N-terminal domain/subunit
MHTNSLDEALALPSERAVTLALRTQQVIAYESGVAEVVDPLGGAYAIEALTDQLEARARELIERIDQLGGMVRAIEEAYPQREIENAAYKAQRAIETGAEVVVGLNQFREEGEARKADLLRLDPAVEAQQKARLQKMRQERDGQAAAEACRAVERAARGTENLLPPIRAAVQALATVGEISDAMRRVFGEYRPGAQL